MQCKWIHAMYSEERTVPEENAASYVLSFM